MFQPKRVAFGEAYRHAREVHRPLVRITMDVLWKLRDNDPFGPVMVTTPSSLSAAVTSSGMVTKCSILSSFTIIFTSVYVSQQLTTNTGVFCIIVMHNTGVRC